MSRTLGTVQNVQSQSQQQNQPFYLRQQLPMFLAHNQGHSGKQSNLDEDMAKCKQLIQSLCDNQIKTKESIGEIGHLIDEEKDLTRGMGYFAAKNMIFLQYMMLIKVYELFKLNGNSLTSGNGLDLYKRLAYLKTLLLKLQPVEKKLQYQKNKILRNADKAIITKQHTKQQSQAEQDESQEDGKHKPKQEQGVEQQEQQEDEMAFKPRPGALMNLKRQKDLRVRKNDKYEAPKVSSNLSKEEKMKQRLQKQKQRRKLGLIRRLQSDLIQDDRAQQKYLGDQINQRLKKKFNQKTNYQQQGLVRLPDNRKDKYFKKQMIRNSLRKNQLQEDFKQVQMVRKLFNEEDQAQNKLVGEKRKKQGTNKKFSKAKSEQQPHMPKKFKKISKK